MADLFTLPEFVSYLQVPEFDTATATLARELATAAIRLQAGPAAYDALSEADLLSLKAVALAVARRVVTNPSGLRSVSIDDYSETYATESLAEAELTDYERELIARVVGVTSSAFTIRPTGQSDCPPPLPRRYLNSLYL